MNGKLCKCNVLVLHACYYTYIMPRECEFQKLHCYPGPPSAPWSHEFLSQSLTSAVMSSTPPTNYVCVTICTIILTNITEQNVYKTNHDTTKMVEYIQSHGSRILWLGLIQEAELEERVCQLKPSHLRVILCLPKLMKICNNRWLITIT